jgi:YHS domain-containing protein
MKKLSFFFACLVIITGISRQATAQDQVSKRLKHYNLEEKLAIDGYDPVAYFSQNKAIAGNKANSYTYQGITYYFASKANQEAFEKDPARYEPQYGGWCAYAMGENGEKVAIDPQTFKVLDGKLYLFYNRFLINTLPKWNKNEPNLKKKADSHWQALYK